MLAVGWSIGQQSNQYLLRSAAIVILFPWCGLIIFAVGILLLLHLYLVVIGKTTSEFLRDRRERQHTSREDASQRLKSTSRFQIGSTGSSESIAEDTENNDSSNDQSKENLMETSLKVHGFEERSSERFLEILVCPSYCLTAILKRTRSCFCTPNTLLLPMWYIANDSDEEYYASTSFMRLREWHTPEAVDYD